MLFITFKLYKICYFFNELLSFLKQEMCIYFLDYFTIVMLININLKQLKQLSK